MPRSKAKTSVRLKRHVERITSKKHVYKVDVGGTRNPENHSIVIRNTGRTYVDKPRVRVGDQCDFFDTQTILKDTLKGFRTDEEKALRKERVAKAKDAMSRSAGMKGAHVAPARAAIKRYLRQLNDPNQPDDARFELLIEAPFKAPPKKKTNDRRF